MSVCGNCPWPRERMYELAEMNEQEREEYEEDLCKWGCTHEDAAYRAQSAYDMLTDRYNHLHKHYKKLYEAYMAIEFGWENERQSFIDPIELEW